jgi:hypothetical protein
LADGFFSRRPLPSSSIHTTVSTLAITAKRRNAHIRLRTRRLIGLTRTPTVSTAPRELMPTTSKISHQLWQLCCSLASAFQLLPRWWVQAGPYQDICIWSAIQREEKAARGKFQSLGVWT